MNMQVWNTPNILSIVRLLLVVPIAILLRTPNQSDHLYAAILIIAAALTDLFDGMLARKLKQVTDVGKIIDPLADKIGVVIVTVILAQQNRIPLWFMIVVLLRDIILLTGGLYLKAVNGSVVQSNTTGKWTVTVVALFILVTVLDLSPLSAVRSYLFAASVVMLLLSFVLYAKRFFDLISV